MLLGDDGSIWKLPEVVSEKLWGGTLSNSLLWNLGSALIQQDMSSNSTQHTFIKLVWLHVSDVRNAVTQKWIRYEFEK